MELNDTLKTTLDNMKDFGSDLDFYLAIELDDTPSKLTEKDFPQYVFCTPNNSGTHYSPRITLNRFTLAKVERSYGMCVGFYTSTVSTQSGGVNDTWESFGQVTIAISAKIMEVVLSGKEGYNGHRKVFRSKAAYFEKCKSKLESDLIDINQWLNTKSDDPDIGHFDCKLNDSIAKSKEERFKAFNTMWSETEKHK